MKQLSVYVRLLTVAVAIFSAHAVRSAEPSPSHPPKSPFCVVGYLPAYHFASFDSSVGEHLTDLIYFSVQPTPAGELNSTDIKPEALQRLQAMKKRHGTRILVAVGGWGLSQNFAPVATDPGKRKRFVQAMQKYCLDHKFDGVDYDWEYPQNDAEKAAYSSLLVETKAALQPHGKLVTVAIEAGQKFTAEACRALDRVHVMSYLGHEGKKLTPLAHVKQDVEKVLANGVSKSKVVLGLPFYGHNKQGNPKDLSYAEIVSRFHPQPGQNLAGGYQFNSPATLREKTRFAINQQIGGVMFWELGQDTHDGNSLLRAIVAERAERIADRDARFAVIYNGPGSAEDGPEAVAIAARAAGLKVTYVSKVKEIPQAIRGAALLAIGGTDDKLEPLRKQFTPEVAQAIQEYIQEGGAYLGFCGGGYLASQGWEDEQGFVHGLGLVPATSDAFIESKAARVLCVRWQGKPRDLYYQLGPKFVLKKTSETVEVVGKYDDDSIAAVLCSYGKGKVFACGPHPEAVDSWRSDFERPQPTWKAQPELATAIITDLLSDRPVGK